MMGHLQETRRLYEHVVLCETCVGLTPSLAARVCPTAARLFGEEHEARNSLVKKTAMEKEDR
jgi:hypothetical protein